jgi:putative hemolysin
MKKFMIRAVVPLAVAAGAALGALALATPASASSPRQTGYMDATSLRVLCTYSGGYFDADSSGSSHLCVLPDGRVILCSTKQRTCVVLERTAPKPDIYGTLPNGDGLQVQGDPGPVPPIAPVTGVRTAHLTQLKW